MQTVLLILVAVGGLTGIGVLGTFGLILVERFKKMPAGSRELRQRLDDLEQRFRNTEELFSQLSRLDERITALDERLDFTERLLQGPRDRERVPPIKS